MAGGGAGLVRRAIADDRAAGHQHRTIGRDRLLQCRRDRLRIMAVDPHRLPAISGETRQDVFRGRKFRRSVDGNAIVVEQHDQAAELQMSRECGRLMGDALHEIAVGSHDPGAVVADLGVARGLHALGNRHADRGGKPLAQRPRGRFDPRQQAVFGMPRAGTAQLAKTPNVRDRRPRVARQIQQRIEQHRAVPGRQHESIPVRPVGMTRIEAQEPRPQNGCHIGKPHRHAGMAGAGGLHRVDGQSPNGVRHIAVADGGALAGAAVGGGGRRTVGRTHA